jgi:type II secretion system protein J
MKKKAYGAFTLIELLISLAILSVIALVSTTTFFSVTRIVEVNRSNEEALRNIRELVERLDVEISAAVLKRGSQHTVFNSKREDVSGIKINDLVFTTIAPQSYLELGTREEVIMIEYDVQQNQDDTDFFVVTKKLFFHPLTPERSREPFEFVVRNDFTQFTLRFYKNGQWFDSWDSDKMASLPEGVELIFSLGGNTYREYFNVFI